MSTPRFKLFYWALPFRGCFVSYQFAYWGVPLAEETDTEVLQAMKSLPASDQLVPHLGPPVLEDTETGVVLSQMPAILQYVSGVLQPGVRDSLQQALSTKIVMDCNDVLMEICCYNGSMMWERDSWIEFRSKRLPRWMSIFEESLRRGHIGGTTVGYADIAVYALFGNMVRCLPELQGDFQDNAPGVYSLCEEIGARPSLATFVAAQEITFGKLYCGGMIEESIREMLELDQGSSR